MSKGIVDTVIGGAEIAAGAVLIATGVGAPFGAALIIAGAGEVMTGIAEMLTKQPGQGVATTNPIGPYNYIYGTMKVPGVEIFSETNSQTGSSTTSNDKQWHRVFALACHPTDSLVEVRLDGQTLNLVQQPSSDPNTTIWQSASPHQTTCNITSISRSGGIVTMKVSGGFARSFNGQTMVVSGVRDNTYNGVWTLWLPNPADLTMWQYCCGGADGSSSGGRCETCLPDYSNKVHIEFQNGNQTRSFPTLLAAQVGSTSPLTWLPTDVCYGHTLVYVQMGYDSAYFPSYPTNLSFIVKGKCDVLDPRTGNRGYTENAALCIADYMAQPRLRGGFGLQIGSTIDQNNLIAAANTCDETLTLAVGGTVPQYSCNTTFNLDTPRGTNIQRMVSSCAGRLSVQGGVWSIIPGAYVAPSLYLNEKNIVGPIKLDTRLSVMEACNAVKGTYVSPANNYQPSDYPLYQQDGLHGFVNNTWLAEDGNEIIVHNLDLPCTNVSAVAQRLAKIQLMRQRYQYRLHLQCDLTAYQATVTDVIGLSFARYNWVNEPFEVLHVGLAYDDNGKPFVELDLAQVDGANSAANSAIYTWSPTEELSITDSLVPNNVGVRVCSPPENVVAYSGPAAIINGIVFPSTITIGPSGVYTNSLYVTWQAPNDTNVVQGGYIEVQYQSAGATDWTAWGRCDPSVNSLFIGGVNVGAQYNVQVRAVNCAGVPSAWVQAGPETISTTYSPFSYNGVPVAPTGTLTAQSSSSGTQITVAPFTPFVYSRLCTPVPSVITGLNPSQLYFVYYVDPTFAGGTITPIATQNEANFLNMPGYFLIGSLVTPAASARYQPSSYTDVGTSMTTAPTAAYDNNTNTAAVISGSYWNEGVAPMPVNGDYYFPAAQGSCGFSGFPAITTTAATTLNVVASFAINGTAPLPASSPSSSGWIASISASVSGTLTMLGDPYQPTAQTTYTLAIPAGTNLSTITVWIDAQGGNAVSDTTPLTSCQGSCSVSVAEIYIQ
jgi:hypothetical protein